MSRSSIVLPLTGPQIKARLSDGTNGHVLTMVAGLAAWAAAGGAAGDLLAVLVNSEVSVTTGTTLTSGAFGKMHVCSGTTADYTVGLPAVSGNAGKFIGFRMDAGLTKIVTLDANSSETIDGSLTRLMWSSETAILLCDGTTWTKIAGKTNPREYIVESSGGQSILNNTITRIAMDTVLRGPASALSSERVYPQRPGTYAVSALITYEYAGNIAGKQAYCGVCLNADTTFDDAPAVIAITPWAYNGSNSYSAVGVATPSVVIAAGDYLAVTGIQDAGVTATTRSPSVVRPNLCVRESPVW